MLQPHAPLAVILSGGEAVVELLRVERSEQAKACVRRTRGISLEILLSFLVTKVTSFGKPASVLTRSLRRLRSSVLDRIVAACGSLPLQNCDFAQDDRQRGVRL